MFKPTKYRKFLRGDHSSHNSVIVGEIDDENLEDLFIYANGVWHSIGYKGIDFDRETLNWDLQQGWTYTEIDLWIELL